MGLIQNMEAMFQTWKNTILRKDLHLRPIGSFIMTTPVEFLLYVASC